MSSITKNKPPRLWRSLAEYENDPRFQEYLHNEFGTPLGDAPPNSKQRRRFMQLMSASFALAGAAGCRWEEDEVLPFTRRPEGITPGVPRYFNTAMELGSVALPLRVKSFDGRPIKVDGNPEHSDSGGAAGIYEQGSILNMYDPDRSRGPAQFAGYDQPAQDVGWVEFKKFALKHFAALRTANGAGLAVLSTSSSSRTLQDLRERFAKVYPQAEWFEYEPVNRDNSRAGAHIAFGEGSRPYFDLAQADVIVSLGSNILGQGPEYVAFAPGFSAKRHPETGSMNRLWAVDNGLSSTVTQADHRLALRAAQISAFTVALEAELSQALGQSPTQRRPDAKFLAEPKVDAYLKALVKDLAAHQGRSAIVVAESQPAEIHALGHRLNALLGNVGKTVNYVPDEGTAEARLGLQRLMQRLPQIKTLVILDGNPAYTASGDVDFANALAQVETSIHLSLYRDETSRRCKWHLPLAHYLETWGDAASLNGSRLICQPLIEPLFEGMSAAEFIALLTRDSVTDGQDLVRRALGLEDDRLWRRAVHDGMVPGSGPRFAQPSVGTIPSVKLPEAALGGLEIHNGQLEITFAADPKLYDGRFANNGWLQECPEPVMKLTWDNAAFMSPATARALGIDDERLVTLELDGRRVTVPALMTPAMAPGSIRLFLGYGRTDAGIVAGTRGLEGDDVVEPVGFDVYKLRSLQSWDFASGVTVVEVGKRYKLATTQDKHPIDETGFRGAQQRLPMIVRQQSLAHYKENPEYIQHLVHHPPLLSLWQEPVSYDGRKWGMTIDLNKCTGCMACVVACNAENNVSVVGKDQVLMGREMHWMRIDRYFVGDDRDEPEAVYSQPMLCQHCEHAPCEQVCPVGATLHTSEGLNDMVYNRCIGTRYCSNNCPYKVRRFNYFHLNLDLKEEKNQVKRLMQNPEVTVRSRGVMEKCSFCVQRIQNHKISARNARRPLKPNEITTACQDTCPTRAIEFGDLNEPESSVRTTWYRPHSYAVLPELNTRPRIRYLARITNKHPDLAPAQTGTDATHGTEGKSEHHG